MGKKKLLEKMKFDRLYENGGLEEASGGIPRKPVAGAKALRSEHDARRARCQEEDEKDAAFEV